MAGKRVLLVHPEISKKKQDFIGVIENEPLELEYFAAALKEKGYDVAIFDIAREARSLEDMLLEFEPHYFYICGRLKQENFMKKHLKLAKSMDSGIITMVGGIHVQHNYEFFYMEEVDYILRSFDIFVMLEVIDCIEQEKTECLGELSGLVFKQGGRWKVNKAVPFDIEKLPLPDRSYFYKHANQYRYLELVPCAQVRTSYSCAYSCKFCYRNTLNFGKYVVRDIEAVVEEIKNIECENIYIIDDDFLIDKKRIKSFVDLIKKYHIRKHYVCFGRADFIVRNKELIMELKEIGFYYILVGLESVEDTELEAYGKHIGMMENKESVAYLNQIGIHMMGMFIVNFDFKWKDFAGLFRFIKRNDLKHVAISIFTPIPGTGLYEEYRNKLITKNPEDFDYFHLVSKPTKIGVRRYYCYYYILMVRLFLRAKRQGVYNFVDYRDYINYFLKAIFITKKL